MRKILVTCECGQQMQTPRSSIGKSGSCMSCGRTFEINSSNTSPLQRGPLAGALNAGPGYGGTARNRSDDARQRFGQAVDLYRSRRYAESLAVFDTLARDFPGNVDIQHSREACIKAMKSGTLLSGSGRTLLLEAHSGPVELDEATVKRVIVEKLLHGSTEEIQLRAAELAARILGMGPGNEANKSLFEDERSPEDESHTETFDTGAEPLAAEPVDEVDVAEPRSPFIARFKKRVSSE